MSDLSPECASKQTSSGMLKDPFALVFCVRSTPTPTTWRPSETTSAAALHTKNPPLPAGFLILYESSGRTIRGRTMPGAAPNWGAQHQASRNIRLLVPPHVSHFMQVPFRIRPECCIRCTSRFSSSAPRRAGFGPSYASRFSVGKKSVLGLRGFQRGRGVTVAEEGGRGEVA
jgi:hypothetical protein